MEDGKKKKAVALMYDPDNMAPSVVASGKGCCDLSG